MITIIVLLILAGVTINISVNQNGIFQRAQKTTQAYNKAEKTEQQGMQNVVDEMDKYAKQYGLSKEESPAWTYEHASQTVTNGKFTLNIGDYVNESADSSYSRKVDGKDFDGKWRVLGVENGELLLVTTNYVDFSGSETEFGLPTYRLAGADDWNNNTGIKKLNALGAKFADGVKTENGRSINVDDINKITGYDVNDTSLNPSDATQRGVYRKDEINQYGNNVTYEIKNDGRVYYKGSVVQTTEQKTPWHQFWKIGENSNITSPFTIKSTGYGYYPETLGLFTLSEVSDANKSQFDNIGISTTSAAYDMLFKSQNYYAYWLASSCVCCNEMSVLWAFYAVVWGSVGPNAYPWLSYYGGFDGACPVRPTVNLKQPVKLKKGTDANTYIIE